MSYVWAFGVGGAMCALAQGVMIVGKLTAAHVMVLFVVLGAVAGALGLYEPLVKLAGAGASVPLPGFGFAMVQGAMQDVHSMGWVGAFSGGLRATGAGIKASVIFALAATLVAVPRR